MIKKLSVSFFAIVFLISCGTTKKISKKDTNSKGDVDFISILSKVEKTYIQDSTISFNSRLEYKKGDSGLPKVNVQTNIRNNELIWANANMIVPIGRALITPKGAKGYAKFPKKVYFDSDYSFIEEKIQLKDLEYEQIESLFTGRPLFALNTKDYTYEKTVAGYVFSYKKNDQLLKEKSKVEVARTIELNQDFVVSKQTFTKPDTNIRVEVYYSDFETVGSQVFPKKMHIKVFDKKNIEVTMVHKTIKVNSAIKTPFKLPTSYKKINF